MAVGVRRAGGDTLLWEQTDLAKPTPTWGGESAEFPLDLTAELGDGDALFLALRAGGVDARDFAVTLHDRLTLTLG